MADDDESPSIVLECGSMNTKVYDKHHAVSTAARCRPRAPDIRLLLLWMHWMKIVYTGVSSVHSPHSGVATAVGLVA